MEFKQLEAFVEVVKEGSFSKAAVNVFLSQPTVSGHISGLEKELGVQLLVRSTKEVLPTKAGEDFFYFAQNILHLRNQAEKLVKEVSAETSGFISILSSSVPAQYLLPEVLADFRKTYPNIIVRVHQATSQEVLSRLNTKNYDFGVVGTRVPKRKFSSTLLCQDVLSLIAPLDMSLDFTQKGSFAEFLQETPFVMRESGSGTIEEMNQYLGTLGLSAEDLPACGYFSDTQSVIQGVHRGMGISMVSAKAAVQYENMGFLQVLPLSQTKNPRSFYLIHPKDYILSPILEEFLNFAAGYYQ